MREKYIEQKLVREVKKRGGLCEKWNSGSSGWPDRLVLLPDKHMCYYDSVESVRQSRSLSERNRPGLFS